MNPSILQLKSFNAILYLCLGSLCFSCTNRNHQKETIDNRPFLGADLSYVNEMQDCSGIYTANGDTIDPFLFFADKGCRLVRLRLWHQPEWTNYSNFQDVQRSIKRAKQAGMEVLLDFHYSDDWADPQRQLIPAAWRNIESMDILGDSVYQYTYSNLKILLQQDLLPEMVQIGNETNVEIMMPDEAHHYDSINWPRNVFLLNKGLEAVADFNKQYLQKVKTMIHIAQPENALQWFPLAHQHGLKPYDWIGLSYYPKWSVFNLDQLSESIKQLKSQFEKRIMIVETAYPHGLYNIDEAPNLLWDDSLIEGFPASPEGQKAFLLHLTQLAFDAGAEGVNYWEPAWISSSCSTRWGNGSHWDNATFFDAQNNNNALPAFDFFNLDLYRWE
jgi:arabinogalactan endo-1,4-beta-galactosidase